MPSLPPRPPAPTRLRPCWPGAGVLGRGRRAPGTGRARRPRGGLAAPRRPARRGRRPRLRPGARADGRRGGGRRVRRTGPGPPPGMAAGATPGAGRHGHHRPCAPARLHRPRKRPHRAAPRDPAAPGPRRASALHLAPAGPPHSTPADRGNRPQAAPLPVPLPCAAGRSSLGGLRWAGREARGDQPAGDRQAPAGNRPLPAHTTGEPPARGRHLPHPASHRIPVMTATAPTAPGPGHRRHPHPQAVDTEGTVCRWGCHHSRADRRSRRRRTTAVSPGSVCLGLGSPSRCSLYHSSFFLVNFTL